MSRNFGIMSGPKALGASSSRPATRDKYASRDLHLDPLLPLLPRSNFAQAMLDIATLIFCSLFICLTGVAISASFFLLFFVNLH
jgi:hypothetical protein